MGTTPRIKVYKIAAVFEIGMSEYDNAMVFMPLKEAQAYFIVPAMSLRSRYIPIILIASIGIARSCRTQPCGRSS